MNGKEKIFYDILFKNCTEKEICDILFKKKEIDDKTPKLRTEDDNKTLRFLFNKMRKFPKDLIAEIKKKCPSLQRKPKTAEQRKEQIRIIQDKKRSEESETSWARTLWARSKFGLWYTSSSMNCIEQNHHDESLNCGSWDHHGA